MFIDAVEINRACFGLLWYWCTLCSCFNTTYIRMSI